MLQAYRLQPSTNVAAARCCSKRPNNEAVARLDGRRSPQVGGRADMSQVKYDFSGKNVMVIGATTGIGRATALAFAQAGADLFVAGLGADHGKSLVEEVKGIGRKIEFREINVRDGAAMKRLHDEAF